MTDRTTTQTDTTGPITYRVERPSGRLLLVSQTRSGGWVVHDGKGAYDHDGDWAPGVAVAHEYPEREDALALACRLAAEDGR